MADALYDYKQWARSVDILPSRLEYKKQTLASELRDAQREVERIQADIAAVDAGVAALSEVAKVVATKPVDPPGGEGPIEVKAEVLSEQDAFAAAREAAQAKPEEGPIE